jgi:hypothetical protein
MLAGCASNSSQVRTRGALDLDCDAANVQVQLTERPYVGVTRYEAAGCGATRSYECRATFYFIGVPMGDRSCRRTGGPAGVAVSPQSVAF